MSRYASLFKVFLDQKGIRYKETQGGTIYITVKAEKAGQATIFIDFDSNGGNEVSIVSFDLGKYSKNQYVEALFTCNSLNQKYRWVRFFITDGNDITVSSDAILDERSFCDECFEYVRRMINIIEEVYPVFDDVR